MRPKFNYMVNFDSDIYVPTFRKNKSDETKKKSSRDTAISYSKITPSYEKDIGTQNIWTDPSNDSMQPDSPQHQMTLGGPSSPFVPVRLPCSDIVGKICPTTNFDFSQIRQTKEQRKLKPLQENERTEYGFRPIIADDEKYIAFKLNQPRLETTDFDASFIIRKLPTVEICFRGDESIDTLSSMGYDGSEHDLDAIFKDSIYDKEGYFVDEEYYNEDRNDKTSISYRSRIVESRQVDDFGTIHLDFDRGRTMTAESIEKDPDLSMVNSTEHKYDKDKDCDLSLDGDENLSVVITLSQKDRRQASTNEGKNMYFNSEGKNSTPPPLAEIVIPVTHDYGYGYYVKPVWSIDDKKSIPTLDRLERVKKLINEGRKLRKRKELAKLVINTIS